MFIIFLRLFATHAVLVLVEGPLVEYSTERARQALFGVAIATKQHTFIDNQNYAKNVR